MIAKPAYTRADIEMARRMARAIVMQRLGSPARRITHRASGLSNVVFEIEHEKGRFIVRIAPDETRLDTFRKEASAIKLAADAGVPVPEVLDVGQLPGARPHMLQRRLHGEPAMHHPARMATLKALGRMARRIGSVATAGFGEVLDRGGDGRRPATLADFLERELDWRARLLTLERHRMLAPSRIKVVEQTIEQLVHSNPRPALAHGDLRLKNVLVDDAGGIVAIIDWDASCSAFAPEWDLALALHDLAIDAKHALIDGWGLTPADVGAMAPTLKALNILHYAPWVARCADAGEEAMLETYRLRLAGSLDLFAL